MTVLMQRDLEHLKRKLLALSALVEENLREAWASVDDRDAELAEVAIEHDFEIDLMEVDIEEECLKILALYQPVAGDLRFLVAALKINQTLERIGDVAVNIAERAIVLVRLDPPRLGIDLDPIAERAQGMVGRSLDSLVKSNTALARLVLAADDEVDDLDKELSTRLTAALRDHPESTEAIVHLLQLVRFVERLADHATSIAEDVLYMVEGEIPRHHMKRQAAEEMGLNGIQL